MNPEEAIPDPTRPDHLSDLDPSSEGLPEPLECLLEAPVPAFLSKTFDLVEDPSLDAIISWAPAGESFVVWDPVEFARFILPQNFKHSNFSSFVRQLNTYGFRKMHAERWEFGNEGFLRGKRHLLRIIQRRKPTGSSGLSLEVEIDKMRKERVGMMQEVMDLQKEQLGTVEDMEVVNKKLHAVEEGQKQMVSFMARLWGQMKLMKEPEALIASPRTMARRKRFAKHGLPQPHNPEETGTGSHERETTAQHLLKTEGVAGEEVFLCGVEAEHLLPPLIPEGKSDFPSSSPVKEEDIWSTGFGDAAGMTSPSHELWGDLGSYGSVLGLGGGGAIGAISDVWLDTDPLQASTSSDMEMYSSYGKPADYI